jgi:hypothetical protein
MPYFNNPRLDLADSSKYGNATNDGVTVENNRSVRSTVTVYKQ